MKKLEDKSVDFVYLDLPYGQTACAWDIKLDLEELWKELKRVARNDRTPFFFSCTTKFGYELIKANEKWFRWDLVWEKNRAAGFLNAYRLPMRKHEMIYCFAKNSPQYDVSSHSEFKEVRVDRKAPNAELYGLDRGDTHKIHKDPLPTSICPPSDEGLETYAPQEHHELVYCFAKNCPDYDVSSHSESKTGGTKNGELDNSKMIERRTTPTFRTNTNHKDKLPTSICPPQENHELVYCFAKDCPRYDVSSHSEYSEQKNATERSNKHYFNEGEKNKGKSMCKAKTHKDPLPTSICPPSDDHELVYCFAKNCPDYDVSSHSEYSVDNRPDRIQDDLYGKVPNVNRKTHTDPLPTSICPPQENHELVYCFAKKSPDYDVSSHSEIEKIIGGGDEMKSTDLVGTPDQRKNKIKYGKDGKGGKLHKDKLPTSICPPSDDHELVYCFAKRSPDYDVSSHLTGETSIGNSKNDIYLSELHGERDGRNKDHVKKTSNEPLPTSICPPSDDHELVYCFAKNCPDYDVSSHKDFKVEGDRTGQTHKINTYAKKGEKCFSSKTHTDPLPTSICPPSTDHELVYCFAKKSPDYDVSSHSEFNEDKRGDNQNMVGDDIETYGKQGQVRVNSKTHKHPLPTSILPPSDDHELVYCFAKNCPDYDVSSHSEGGLNDNQYSRSITCPGYGKDKSNIIKPKSYKDPLPTSICPQQPSSWCKFHLDNKTGHRTAKPVKLMEYLLKYWTSPDSVVLDPTMGSGSMGIACKKMGRNFIGIELDDDIYELATKRIGEAVSDEEAIKKEKIQKEKSEKEKLEKEKLREIAKQAKAKLPKKPRAKKKSVPSK